MENSKENRHFYIRAQRVKVGMLQGELTISVFCPSGHFSKNIAVCVKHLVGTRVKLGN